MTDNGLQLVRGDNPILSQVSEQVLVFDDELKDFVEEMYDAMLSSSGIGLAANQVGDSRRIIATYVAEQRLTLINPIIVEQHGWGASIEEGCLSFPDVFVRVNRCDSLRIKAQDANGAVFELETNGHTPENQLLAICIQHEIDHLNGITFLKYASRQVRRRVERKLKKGQR